MRHKFGEEDLWIQHVTPTLYLLQNCHKYQEVNLALENDGDDNIDHSHIPQILLETESLNWSNWVTESIPHESQTRQQPKLSTGFEYTAWLTTAFFSEYEACVQDPSW